MVAIGTFVPYYDVYGHQHHRTPFKDKGVFGVQKPLWTHKAKFKTRSELIQHRIAEKTPHISFDIDGDNVVSDNDYFIARHFDKGAKGRLTKTERAACDEALRNGFRDQFLMGLEKHGISPYAIQQKRGKIVTQDTAFEIGETYPQHYNANVVPKHDTLTEMKRDRVLEKKEAAKQIKHAWDQKNPVKVQEPAITIDRFVEDPPYTNLKQAGQAAAEEQRVKCGLYPMNTYVNPDRENMQAGLRYVDEPEFPSRSHLLAHRKEMLVQDLDAARIQGEETTVPPSVRRNEREANAFEFRRCPNDAMTRTLIEKQRKCERVEYDRTHFGEQTKQLPRYSDQPQPFWMLARCSSAPAVASHAGAQKCPITEPMPLPEPTQPFPSIAPTHKRPQTVGGEGERIFETNEKTVKRWSTQKLECQNRRHDPRLFDSLTPVKTVAADYMPAELFSSFEVVRRNHQRKLARQAGEEAQKSQLPDHIKNRDTTIRTMRRSQSAATRTRTGPRHFGDANRPRRPVMSAPSTRPQQKSARITDSRFASEGNVQSNTQIPPAKMADTLMRQTSAPHIRTGIRTGV